MREEDESNIANGWADTEDKKLKTCPFCQQQLKLNGGDMVHPVSWCILSGDSWPVENAATWNRRTPDPMLEELAECLGEILPMVANACDERRYENALQSLQKYQQSKVQP